MKIAFITDQHFDQHNRFEETVRIHDWIADDAERRRCEYTLLGGDLFERKSTPQERNAIADWLRQMAAFSKVIGIYGNHDVPGDLDIFERLETTHRIEMHSTPCVTRSMDLAIACLPWPRRVNLLAALGDTSKDAANQAGHAALQAILLQLGTELREFEGAKLFLGHVQTRGSKTSTGQDLVGCDFELGLENLSLIGADFYALGHIHLGPGNEWQVGGAPAIYGGSPRRCNFGESEEKSYTVIEFDGPQLVGWERVPTPARAMVLLEAEWRDGDLEGLDVAEVPDGSEVRLRYSVARDYREAARVAARKWAETFEGVGATVKIEEKLIVETSARAPAVGQARTIKDKLGAFWRSRDTFPGVDRAERIFSKLNELEEEIRAA